MIVFARALQAGAASHMMEGNQSSNAYYDNGNERLQHYSHLFLTYREK